MTLPAPRTSSARTSRAIDIRDPRAACAPQPQRAIDAEGLNVRLHQGGELAHIDALELDDRELELIAQGPRHAPWLLLECPFEGLDDAFDAAVERLTSLGLRAADRPPGADVGPDRPPAAARRGRRAAAGQRLVAARRPRPARAGDRREALVDDGLAYCLASDAHPGTRERILPLADDALRRLGVSDVQAFRLTRSNPRFLLREGNPRLTLPTTEDRLNRSALNR